MLVLDEPTASLDAHETELLVPDRARSQVARHRDRLHHALHRSGLRDRRPHLGPAQRPPGRRGADRRIAAAEADLDDARSRARACRGAPDDPCRAGGRRAGPGGRGARAPAHDGAFRSLSASRRGCRAGGPAGVGTHRNRQADVRGDPPGFGTIEAERRADRAQLAAPVAAPRHRLLPGGPQGRGTGRRAQRAREHHARACRRKRGWLHRLSAGRAGAAGRGDDQGARHRDARRGQAGRAALRRQPAEGGAGALAGVAAAMSCFSTSRRAASTSAPTPRWWR